MQQILYLKTIPAKKFLKTNKFQSFWIITSSFLINLLALSGALYVIQVFNKYLNYKQDTTLIALTLGVIIAFLLEFFLRIIRSYLLNKTTNLTLKNFSYRIISLFILVFIYIFQDG